MMWYGRIRSLVLFRATIYERKKKNVKMREIKVCMIKIILFILDEGTKRGEKKM